MGFYGVIDERLNLDLVRGIAERRPEWQLVLAGPVAKIDEHALPQGQNIHYLGAKKYDLLPTYLAGWDVAIMPFAHNDSTRYISPTKTLEYLAGGKPVISTGISDVVTPYGTQGLVRIAETPDDFVTAAEAALAEEPGPRLAAADAYLATTSWHRTWNRMAALIEAVAEVRRERVVAFPQKIAAARGEIKQRSGKVLPFPLSVGSVKPLVAGEGVE